MFRVLRFETLFTALGAIFRAFDEFEADQFDHCLFGTVAFAIAETHDASITTVALAEARTRGIEQFLNGRRSFEERGLLGGGRKACPAWPR